MKIDYEFEVHHFNKKELNQNHVSASVSLCSAYPFLMTLKTINFKISDGCIQQSVQQ